LDSSPVTVSITVNPVNDPPTFNLIANPNQNVLNNAGPQTVPNFAVNISPGPPDESGQTVAFQVSNNNNGIFAIQPAISPTGTLSYTPASNGNGDATVTVVLKDNGGTANGGSDTSAPQTFTIMVRPPDVPPTANNTTASTNEDTAVTITVSGSDTDSP